MGSTLKEGTLIVSSSPHFFSRVSTSKVMRDVIIALIPAILASFLVFGLRALLLTLICVVSAVIFEYLFQIIAGKPKTIGDFSAVVTGVLLGLSLPPELPFWMAIIGSFIAIVVVKQIFGGIGYNFANPAATARVVLLISFATPMTTWSIPNGIMNSADSVSGATPLGLAAKGDFAAIPDTIDLFLGTVGGSIGETSAIALLIGGLYLIFRKIIGPATPLAFLGSMAIFCLLTGNDPVFHILSGGAMMGAFFMATDYSTSPNTTAGKVIFGAGCGLITMLIRVYGSYPEGVSFAILLMNILVPHIDNLSRRRLYGGGEK